MGLTCSKPSSSTLDFPTSSGKRWKGGKKGDAYRLASNAGVPDPEMYHFLQRSVQLTQQYQLALQEKQQQQQKESIAEVETEGGGVEGRPNQQQQSKNAASVAVLGGQYHLLYKQQQSPKTQHTLEDLVASSYVATSPPQEQRPPSKKKKNQQLRLMTKSGVHVSGAPSTGTSPLKWPHQHKKSLQSTLSLYDIQFRTKLLLRRHGARQNYEEGHSGTHIYALRWPMKTRKATDISSSTGGGSQEMVLLDDMDEFFWFQQQDQQEHRSEWEALTEDEPVAAVAVDPPRPLLPPEPVLTNSSSVTLSTDHLFHASTMALPPKRKGMLMYGDLFLFVASPH